MATKAQAVQTSTQVESKSERPEAKILAISFLGDSRKALLTQDDRGFAVKVIQNGKQQSATFYNVDNEGGITWARMTAVMHLRRISGSDV